MKKITLLTILLLFFTSCSILGTEKEVDTSGSWVEIIDTNVNSWDTQVDNNSLTSNLPEGSFAYSETLEVSWVGPEVSSESWIPDNTLALRYTNLEESYTDHLFIDASLWENFNNGDDLTLPWNKVLFDGIIYSLEWAAGNHYYQVASINKLEKVDNPTKERVEKIIDSFSYCEADNECSSFYWECPFGCQQAVNTKYLDIAQKVMKNWYDNNEPKCVYDCVAIKWVKCENYKCSTIPEEIIND
jgi:hypothetical protein